MGEIIFYIMLMPDLFITCPHCNMQITFGIGNDSAKPNDGEFLGFVFSCPSCQTPVSYQSNEDHAVELDQNAFENFKKAMEKKMGKLEGLEGAAFSGPAPAKSVNQATSQTTIEEDIYSNMLKDIRESDNFDDFLKRIGN